MTSNIKTDFKDEDIESAYVLAGGKDKPYIAITVKNGKDINLEYNELTAMLTMLYRKTNELKKEGK